jgi:hypothetical protein
MAIALNCCKIEKRSPIIVKLYQVRSDPFVLNSTKKRSHPFLKTIAFHLHRNQKAIAFSKEKCSHSSLLPPHFPGARDFSRFC